MPSRKTTGFAWTPKKIAAAVMLAEGHTRAEAAEKSGVRERAIYVWLNAPEFSAEVDRLSVMVGIASRAGRMRIAHKLIRQRVRGGEIETEKDLLDWLKFAQSETNGVQSDLAASIADLISSLVGGAGATDSAADQGSEADLGNPGTGDDSGVTA